MVQPICDTVPVIAGSWSDKVKNPDVSLDLHRNVMTAKILSSSIEAARDFYVVLQLSSAVPLNDVILSFLLSAKTYVEENKQPRLAWDSAAYNPGQDGVPSSVHVQELVRLAASLNTGDRVETFD